MATKSTPKKRNWVFILYPESAPADWLQRIQSTGLTSAVSPLHDKDKNPDGEPKKPHHHIILCYPGPTTFNVVSTFTDSLKATIPQACESIKGQYRYFTHLDNPEKYPYDPKDIRVLNGFDIRDYVEMTSSEIQETKKNIIAICKAVPIFEYRQLIDFLLEHDMPDEFYVASTNTMFFNTYLTSARYEQKGGKTE